MVKLRFSRIGRPHDPYFRLVVTDHRQARDAKPIEVLGTFNPAKKDKPEIVNADRIKYWIGVGAKPTESVLYTLKKAGLWADAKPTPQPKKA